MKLSPYLITPAIMVVIGFCVTAGLAIWWRYVTKDALAMSESTTISVIAFGGLGMGAVLAWGVLSNR